MVFYEVQDTKIEMLKKVDGAFNWVAWNPQGQYCVVTDKKKSGSGESARDGFPFLCAWCGCFRRSLQPFCARSRIRARDAYFFFSVFKVSWEN